MEQLKNAQALKLGKGNFPPSATGSVAEIPTPVRSDEPAPSLTMDKDKVNAVIQQLKATKKIPASASIEAMGNEDGNQPRKMIQNPHLLSPYVACMYIKIVIFLVASGKKHVN